MEITTAQEDTPLHIKKEKMKYFREKTLRKRTLLFITICFIGLPVLVLFHSAIIYSISSLFFYLPYVTDEVDTIIILVCESIGFILLLSIFRSVRHFILESIDWRPLKKVSTYVWILIALIINNFSQDFFIRIIQLDNPDPEDIFSGMTPDNISFAIFLVITFSVVIKAPIVEEMFFRGFILRFFELKYNKAWLGLIISSIIFGVLHIGYPISSIISGLLFGLLYLKYRTITVPMVAHFAWNVYASYVQYIFLFQ